MTEPVIKPCPFCGRHPSYTSMAGNPAPHVFSCQCGTYEITARAQWGDRAGALLRWNTRVDLVTVDGMNVRALKELCDLVTAWRDAKCSFPGPRYCEPLDDKCDGENHLENCAQELALQEVLAIHNKLVPR